jgi:hypothetical protein
LPTAESEAPKQSGRLDAGEWSWVCTSERAEIPVFGQKTIPDVRVSLDDRDIPVGVIASEEMGRCGKQSLIKIEPRARQAIGDAVAETFQFVRQALQVLVHGASVEPSSHRRAQAGIIPPLRMKTCSRTHYDFALLEGRRQRPHRRDRVGIGQVLEQ